jgi:hypothetical protein
MVALQRHSQVLLVSCTCVISFQHSRYISIPHENFRNFFYALQVRSWMESKIARSQTSSAAQLGYYTTFWNRCFGTTYRFHLPCVKMTILTLEDAPIGSPETSVSNYLTSLTNPKEEKNSESQINSYRFLLNPLQFTIHSPLNHSTSHSLSYRPWRQVNLT